MPEVRGGGLSTKDSENLQQIPELLEEIHEILSAISKNIFEIKTAMDELLKRKD